MNKNKTIKIILQISLFLAIPMLVFLAQKKASALITESFSKQDITLIRKPNLARQTLKQRLDWLEKFIPKRIPEILEPIDKNQTKITLIAYKKEQVLELWLNKKSPQLLKSYTFTNTSGKLGPKNKQGDQQIPEGIYRANRLNPNSAYYLSIGINYPNVLDKKRSVQNMIRNSGGDIFIHGRNNTVGCIPIGDHFIEEVFYIVGNVGLLNTEVLIAPSKLPLPDLNALGLPKNDSLLVEKYSQLSARLAEFH